MNDNNYPFERLVLPEIAQEFSRQLSILPLRRETAACKPTTYGVIRASNFLLRVTPIFAEKAGEQDQDALTQIVWHIIYQNGEIPEWREPDIDTYERLRDRFMLAGDLCGRSRQAADAIITAHTYLGLDVL